MKNIIAYTSVLLCVMSCTTAPVLKIMDNKVDHIKTVRLTAYHRTVEGMLLNSETVYIREFSNGTKGPISIFMKFKLNRSYFTINNFSGRLDEEMQFIVGDKIFTLPLVNIYTRGYVSIYGGLDRDRHPEYRMPMKVKSAFTGDIEAEIIKAGTIRIKVFADKAPTVLEINQEEMELLKKLLAMTD